MKKGLILMLLSCISVFSYGQATVISGRVLEESTGQPLPGANVIARPSGLGTTTDMDGNYQLEIEAGDDSLVFSFIGYQNQAVLINGRTTINVSLEEEVNVLEELVVIGYGVQRKSDLTGAVSSVREKDLVKIPAASPLQALQGKVAGVQVSNTDGAPGASPVVRIRGVGTINGAGPIYVVDNIILDDISFLNTSDIQSIEVLKDASATAIYGSRGANGVVIITTKSGGDQKGNAIVNFSYDYSIQQLPKKIDLLNGRQFAEVVNQIYPGTYNNLDLVPNTDWQDLVYRENAPIHNANFSISGNSDKNTYYFGLGYFFQEGIIPKSDYERISFKLNNMYNFTDNIRVGINLSVSPQERTNAAGVVATIYRAQPTSVPYNDDGSYAEVLGSANPLASIEYNNSTTKIIRGIGNIFGEVDFLKDFTFRSSFGYDYENVRTVTFTPEYYVSAVQSNDRSKLTKKQEYYNTWLWENTVSYNKQIDRHNFTALAGYTSQESTNEIFEGAAYDLINDDPSLWYFKAASTEDISMENRVDYSRYFTMISYLFRVNYSFDSRYLFTASYRQDGSSKFGRNNRYAGFPSLAAGWNIANEDFFTMPAFSRLKVRASWGTVGNEKIANDKQYSLIDNTTNATFGPDEVPVPGTTYGGIGNPGLRWETTSQTDVGLEVGLWNDKLSIEADYYHKVTEDILIRLLSPGHQGSGDNVYTTFNAATVLNSGFEWNVSWNETRGDFYYRVAFLGNTVHNEVRALNEAKEDDSEDFIAGGPLNNGQLVTRTEVGQPIGSFYGYQVIGVFQTQAEVDNSATFGNQQPGDLKFQDTNGDGMIDDQDRVLLGSYIPDLIYGFNIEASYKGVFINLDFYGVYGNEIYNGKNAVRPDLYNFEASAYDYWRGEGTSNTEPRPTAGGTNYEPSSYFVQNGSYFRLRSAQVGYELPRSWLSGIRATTARVFVKGTNVFTLSDFTGYSPDLADSDPLKSGIDLGTYPLTRIISFGFNLTF